MFKFAQDGKVYWPVNLVAFDAAEGAEPVDVKVAFLFKRYTRTELRAREKLLEKPMALLRVAKTEEEISTALDTLNELNDKADADMADRVLGWRGVFDIAGKPLEFSPEVLAALLDDEAQYKRIAAGLNEASRGAKAKNSSPGPAGSPAPGQT
jgi:hypothetical protein